MSQSTGPDFNLPDEILSVMPTDPYDQLDLARKITSMAIASRVSKLESETRMLWQQLQEKDRVIVELEEKLLQLEQAAQEAELRLRITCEDNTKLAKERDSLALTGKKLSHDLAKLEKFKRQLLQSLNDENSPAETFDIGTYDQSVPKAYPTKDGEVNGLRRNSSFTGSSESTNVIEDASKQGGRKFITPNITPGLTPSGTPKSYSTAGSPLKTSGATSPMTGHGSLSSWYPSSQQSSAVSSPPRGRTLPARPPRIDGRKFFHQVRSRLLLEQFSAFLANVKELNAHRQSREETLRKAEEIFGTDNKDLFLSFQALLNRNMN